MRAESFAKKVLIKMCINSSEFMGKDHATKKQALEDAGVKAGDRFFLTYRTVLFLCAVSPAAVTKVSENIPGSFADSHLEVGEAFLKEAKKLLRKQDPEYPEALQIVKLIFPTVKI